MGSFYANVTVLGAERDAVSDVCRKPAYLAVDGDVVVVFARDDDEGAIATRGEISERLGCVTLGVLVHDSDILAVEVFDRGRSVAEFAVPDPAAFFGFDPAELGDLASLGLDSADLGPGLGANAAPDASSLVAALGRGDVASVASALTDEFVFAEDRHLALLDALGLPTFASGRGYRYLAADAPDASGETALSVVHVG